MANSFVWYDLMTPDIRAAEAFYAAVFDWSGMDAGFSDRSYTLMSARLPQGSSMVARRQLDRTGHRSPGRFLRRHEQDGLSACPDLSWPMNPFALETIYSIVVEV